MFSHTTFLVNTVKKTKLPWVNYDFSYKILRWRDARKSASSAQIFVHRWSYEVIKVGIHEEEILKVETAQLRPWEFSSRVENRPLKTMPAHTGRKSFSEISKEKSAQVGLSSLKSHVWRHFKAYLEDSSDITIIIIILFIFFFLL